jgi:hypothetical protein
MTMTEIRMMSNESMRHYNKIACLSSIDVCRKRIVPLTYEKKKKKEKKKQINEMCDGNKTHRTRTRPHIHHTIHKCVGHAVFYTAPRPPHGGVTTTPHLTITTPPC